MGMVGARRPTKIARFWRSLRQGVMEVGIGISLAPG